MPFFKWLNCASQVPWWGEPIVITWLIRDPAFAYEVATIVQDVLSLLVYLAVCAALDRTPLVVGASLGGSAALVAQRHRHEQHDEREVGRQALDRPCQLHLTEDLGGDRAHQCPGEIEDAQAGTVAQAVELIRRDAAKPLLIEDIATGDTTSNGGTFASGGGAGAGPAAGDAAGARGVGVERATLKGNDETLMVDEGRQHVHLDVRQGGQRSVEPGQVRGQRDQRERLQPCSRAVGLVQARGDGVHVAHQLAGESPSRGGGTPGDLVQERR